MDFIPHSEEDRKNMLKKIGISDIEELFSSIPEKFRLKEPLKLPKPISEAELDSFFSDFENKKVVSFMGAGAYDHLIPSAIDPIVSRGEFFTAYTPYQAEVSQGTLQAIYEFQSLIAHLTGLEAANASMYDGASAAAEAALMAQHINDNKEIILINDIHPGYIKVIKTFLQGLEIDILEMNLDEWKEWHNKNPENKICSLVVQQPTFYGTIKNLEGLADQVHSHDGIFIMIVNPISLALLKTPAEWGADIAIGEGQPLGMPLSFGGPYLGFFSCLKKYVRKMPGRIVGMTKDSYGKRGFVLTLQTREQHIRREKATSNICSNQALCALRATVYLSLLGPKGLKEVAEQSAKKAHFLSNELSMLKDLSLPEKEPFFNEFVLRLSCDAETIFQNGLKQGIIPGIPLSKFFNDRKNDILIAVTERKTKEDLERLIKFFREG
ncbi:MAG: aminomethyl-transferring glycine dehydrogenase subunit GcvPA [Candidatus Coatesbacteria bacterium]|nr:aminomethyl-transferring glycine dehydrogenase subunit GcvPA [Candidatus Coatesbacteria bacterium]